LSWFNRLFQPTEAGWVMARTPDGLPLMDQDAFFWRALEIIARELNAMRAAELQKLTNR
jgi:hypothetical protein